MKNDRAASIFAVGVICLLMSLVLAVQSPAQQHPRYKLLDLGPFNGGLQSYLNIQTAMPLF